MTHILQRFSVAIVFILASAAAQATTMVTVDAKNNSSSGSGGGLNTGISLTTGEFLSISVDPDDLWNAGPLPRWSNADGLIADLYATGTDESGEAAGTLIGTDFGTHTQDGFTAPFGALVGQLASTYFLIGTSFSGPAPDTGDLYLYYWDSNNHDNTEDVLADITVAVSANVPEPAPVALLALALLVMGFIAVQKQDSTLIRLKLPSGIRERN